MKKLFTIISCSLFALGVYAQADCTGGRYFTENLFSTVDVTEAITFGNNNALGGGPVDLKMDVYEPRFALCFWTMIVTCSKSVFFYMHIDRKQFTALIEFTKTFGNRSLAVPD